LHKLQDNYIINFLFALFYISFRFKVRIGDKKHSSKEDDANLLILDILGAFKHPQYVGAQAYFDVAILETKNITFSRGIRPVCFPR
jgi:hypothetical protein